MESPIRQESLDFAHEFVDEIIANAMARPYQPDSSDKGFRVCAKYARDRIDIFNAVLDLNLFDKN